MYDVTKNSEWEDYSSLRLGVPLLWGKLTIFVLLSTRRYESVQCDKFASFKIQVLKAWSNESKLVELII